MKNSTWSLAFLLLLFRLGCAPAFAQEMPDSVIVNQILALKADQVLIAQECQAKWNQYQGAIAILENLLAEEAKKDSLAKEKK